jgi:hypothetical protein
MRNQLNIATQKAKSKTSSNKSILKNLLPNQGKTMDIKFLQIFYYLAAIILSLFGMFAVSESVEVTDFMSLALLFLVAEWVQEEFYSQR